MSETPPGNRHFARLARLSVKCQFESSTVSGPELNNSIQSEVSPSASTSPWSFTARNSLMTTPDMPLATIPKTTAKAQTHILFPSDTDFVLSTLHSTHI